MSQAPPGYVTEVVFNARVHALEVKLAVLDGRTHPTSITDETTLVSMIQQRDAALRERDAAHAATATAVSDRDAANRGRYTAVKERDTAVGERDTAVSERDTAYSSLKAALSEQDITNKKWDTAINATVKEWYTAVSERDTALQERDAARAALALRSTVTPNMVEQYDRIKDRLGNLYQGTEVGRRWEQRQENELDNIHRAFTNNHRSMADSL
ncbi:hypothetical protein DFP73DRAFT_588337 [Morchella snyderi]|nr:hypothetical protein DFP73DRAFT_588337 [Morchella snyderi]